MTKKNNLILVLITCFLVGCASNSAKMEIVELPALNNEH